MDKDPTRKIENDTENYHATAPDPYLQNLQYTELEKEQFLEEVKHAVYDLFVAMRRLAAEPVTFNEIEDAYRARAPGKPAGYPDGLVEAVKSWISANSSADGESDQLFKTDDQSTAEVRWYINQTAIPADVWERRSKARPIPLVPKPRRRLKYGVVL